MENQERCFYKIAHITVAKCHRVPKLFLINANYLMKMLEHVEEGLIRQRVEIDEMQCGLMLGCGTTVGIFIVHQLQEKHLIANKPLYMAFVYLEKKAFDCVHQDFIWLAMPTHGTDEWLVHLVQSMYMDVRSHVRVGDGYCQ